jgi:hypothetical protein
MHNSVKFQYSGRKFCEMQALTKNMLFCRILLNIIMWNLHNFVKFCRFRVAIWIKNTGKFTIMQRNGDISKDTTAILQFWSEMQQTWHI